MSQPTTRQRVRYWFDSFMSRGGFSIFLSLLIVLLLFLVVIGVLRSLVYSIWGSPDETLYRQVYVVFLQLTDPGNMNLDVDQDHVPYQWTAILAGLIGVVIFSALIALITTSLDQRLQMLKKGHSKVIEERHTLILGWNDRVIEILRELAIANESEGDACVVILSEREKEEMDDYLNVQFTEAKTTRVVSRSGPVSSLVNLDIVSVASCKSVIILASCSDAAAASEKVASDSRVIKTILGVMTSKPEGKELNVVAELFEERSREVAEAISADVSTIDTNDILARVMVQTSRSTGLSTVYSEIMSFDGCEMYFYNASWPSGLTFAQAQFHFPDGVPLGIRRDGQVTINPPPTTPMESGDDVLILAEDDSTIEFRKQPVAEARDLALKEGKLAKEVENNLIIGWNPKAPLLIREYNDYVLEGSSLRVVVHEPEQDAIDTVNRLRESLSNLNVILTRLDPMSYESLERIEPWTYNNIIILSQGGNNPDPETTDSQSIVILLLLRRLFDSHPQRAGGTKIISEVMDSKNQELVSRAGVNDFIISNRLISMLMAQVSEEADIKMVYDQLFSEDGSEIYLKPLSLYTSQFPFEATFADLMALAQKRGEVCLGVKIQANERDGTKNYGVKLIPMKETKYALQENDCLVVVSEDET